MNTSIDFIAARAIAVAYARELAVAVGDEFEILEGSTIEDPKGWLFFYNSADFVRTRSPTDSLAGNGPILVLLDGAVLELPSAVPWDVALKNV